MIIEILLVEQQELGIAVDCMDEMRVLNVF